MACWWFMSGFQFLWLSCLAYKTPPMEIDDNLYVIVNGMIWPLLSIFELVIAVIAQNKFKHSSTGIMLAGALIGVLTSLSYPLISMFGYYGEAITITYALLNIIGVVASVLFLIGLLNLVNHLATLKQGENTIAESL